MPSVDHLPDFADYPAAHSMDTEWFAMDDEGHVALFGSGEVGVLPETAHVQTGFYDVWEYLARDEYGIAVFAAPQALFPAGPDCRALQAHLEALAPAQREAVSLLARDKRQTRKALTIDGVLPRQEMGMLVWLREPLLSDESDEHVFWVGSRENPCYRIEGCLDSLRLDAHALVYVMCADLHDLLALLEQGLVVAWREMTDIYEMPDDWYPDLLGLYRFEADWNSIPACARREACMPEFPPVYRRKATPQQPRTALPAELLAARVSEPLERTEKPFVQHLPQVSFARREDIQPADLVPCKGWGIGPLHPESGESIIRRNILLIHGADADTLGVQVLAWQQAAEQGDCLAQYSLGYHFSHLPQPDHATALRWYRAAADQRGDAPAASADMFENGSAAQYRVAEIHEKGIGVEADPAAALEWYARSALRDNEPARERLEELLDARIGTGKGVVTGMAYLLGVGEGCLPGLRTLLESITANAGKFRK